MSLPDFMEDGGNAELQSHLKACTNCSGLVTSLQSIIHEAHYLQASEEPSPRVWNSLEIILRQEKLIREPRASHSWFLPYDSVGGWRPGWCRRRRHCW